MARRHPPFPADGDWVERLHWTIFVMDGSDRDLGFAASLLAYAFKFGELSECQERYAVKVVDRVRLHVEFSVQP
jgi:hypothetical protein